MTPISNNLKGGNLPSIGNVKSVISEVTNQFFFDELFEAYTAPTIWW
ncbi:MAG TPA: hypothetical protein VK809_05435 [Bacteroidia bacterium]|nr:hypothetical protein [Bacteroidia bacterium]